ncbi:MAG: hypothetical protein KJ046_16710 [Anaerolineae bacterium]|nr:hypothetical protein [Anaerolineae bacterium]
MKTIKLPGSEPDEAGGGGAGTGGRLSADEMGALRDVAAWWRNRLAAGDSAEPLETLIGGADLRGTARTSGLTPAAVDFGRPLLATSAAGSGAALLVLALGVPDPPVVGEVYSLMGLGHFYHAEGSGWLSRYTTIGRAPAGTTSTELRTAVDPGGALSLLLVGVSGLVIAWQVEAYRLER